MQTSLKQWGNSIAVRIPQALLEQGNFQKDDMFDIKIRNNEIVLKRISSSRQKKLESMLSKITPQNIHKRMDFGAPVGKELL
ncbi:AbrB/MazE/SpoVT family DNA-binding domain-containing protein [uncultured Sutterella sp.]|uniref:AbrB/MazE/SpoVT family DNA-binding domain-containing protein n=1 Tax=uncultured Sutterella sp. TaxID=286133 RepID=UPI002622D432|nr:AbrB/MazE/SpoVT family DNA-binding domain-containing protein [uncultured Sutterella sp.]